MIEFGSVCSGIEAASAAWHPLGWKAAWLSEIEPFPSAVLAHHYPNVPNLGDMTTLPERILSGEVKAPDVFCGGTPCQAFSVAGLRKSLEDARGNLSLTFVGIANAIDHVRSVRSDKPAVIFWENVPGVLSTKDNAFGCFLGALAGEDDPLVPSGDKWTNAGCVYGPQRAVAWRVLDAQYFGVAQRRRRVFVVASARDDFDPAAVLFEFDGLRRDTAPSRKAGKAAAGSTGGRIVGGVDYENNAHGADDPTGPLLKGSPTGGGRPLPAIITMAHGQGGAEIGFDRGPTLTCNHEAPIAAYSQPIALQDVTPREKAQNGKGWNDDGTSYTVDTHATQGVAQPMVLMDQGGSVMNVEHDMVGTLRRETHGHEPVVVQPYTVGNTLTARMHKGINTTLDESQTPVISIHPHCIGRAPEAGPQGKEYLLDGSAYCMDSRGQPQAVALPIAFAQNQRDEVRLMHVAGALAAEPGAKQQTYLHQAMQVRRLTPEECEALQGFPRSYTAIPWRKKPASECPDGPRYKALGNSWAVPVVHWIGKRINQHMKGES